QDNGVWGVNISDTYQDNVSSSEYDSFKNSLARDTLYDAYYDNGNYYTYGVEIPSIISGGAEEVSGAPTSPPPFPFPGSGQ
ncbi:MAG: hypothetical protein IKR46_04730, partial [Clostridia bacterium]|nr:hypothetical protein [Clostridia bacterium]